MATPSRLDRALAQYTRATARIDEAARNGQSVDVTEMAATRGRWENEARAQGATDADLEAAGRAGIKDIPRGPNPPITVEVAALDQHGDPGFVHYRGDFHTATSAGSFALIQAAALANRREVDHVAVSITAEIATGSRTDLEFIGTPGELAAELAALPDYASSIRRVVFPAPEQVTAATERIAATTPPLPELDADSVGVLEVEVYSTRPDPLPNSRTDLGLYDDKDAYRIAEELAGELNGSIALVRGDSVLQVTHAAEVTDTDRAAAERYTRVEELRANIAALDPVVDAGHITALSADIAELRARVPAELAAPEPDPGVDRDRSLRADVGLERDRPQRLVFSTPAPSPTSAAPQMSAASPAGPTVNLHAENSHGLG